MHRNKIAGAGMDQKCIIKNQSIKINKTKRDQKNQQNFDFPISVKRVFYTHR